MHQTVNISLPFLQRFKFIIDLDEIEDKNVKTEDPPDADFSLAQNADPFVLFIVFSWDIELIWDIE